MNERKLYCSSKVGEELVICSNVIYDVIGELPNLTELTIQEFIALFYNNCYKKST